MSNSLNSVLIDGNLTRDPEVRQTGRGTKVCNFAVASNRFYEQNDEKVQEVSFFDVECWARLAEASGTHLTKGRGVRIVGRLKQDRWQDTEGKNHSRVKIVAEHIIFKPSIRKAEADGSETEISDGGDYDITEIQKEMEREELEALL